MLYSTSSNHGLFLMLHQATDQSISIILPWLISYGLFQLLWTIIPSNWEIKGWLLWLPHQWWRWTKYVSMSRPSCSSQILSGIHSHQFIHPSLVQVCCRQDIPWHLFIILIGQSKSSLMHKCKYICWSNILIFLQMYKHIMHTINIFIKYPIFILLIYLIDLQCVLQWMYRREDTVHRLLWDGGCNWLL